MTLIGPKMSQTHIQSFHHQHHHKLFILMQNWCDCIENKTHKIEKFRRSYTLPMFTSDKPNRLTKKKCVKVIYFSSQLLQPEYFATKLSTWCIGGLWS